jgi:mono/diheme cytochrome c family protein
VLYAKFMGGCLPLARRVAYPETSQKKLRNQKKRLGEAMMSCRAGLALLFVAALSPTGVSAQQFPDPANLNDTEKLGQRLFHQSCGVCHTKPVVTAAQFGPVLSRESAGGNADVMRQVISDGTPRMPGFKLHFDASQIGALVAYLQKVPPPPPAPPPAAPR